VQHREGGTLAVEGHSPLQVQVITCKYEKIFSFLVQIMLKISTLRNVSSLFSHIHDNHFKMEK
jgi:hypothetical protein